MCAVGGTRNKGSAHGEGEGLKGQRRIEACPWRGRLAHGEGGGLEED